MDMADMLTGKTVVKKSALKTRIRGLCRTRAAHVAAGRCVSGLRTVCREVIRRRGAASSKSFRRAACFATLAKVVRTPHVTDDSVPFRKFVTSRGCATEGAPRSQGPGGPPCHERSRKPTGAPYRACVGRWVMCRGTRRDAMGLAPRLPFKNSKGQRGCESHDRRDHPGI